MYYGVAKGKGAPDILLDPGKRESTFAAVFGFRSYPSYSSYLSLAGQAKGSLFTVSQRSDTDWQQEGYHLRGQDTKRTFPSEPEDGLI